MKRIILGVAFALVCGAAAAETSCRRNPDALGTSRELVVSAADYPLLGKMQYRQTLPLAEREVVLTFDDGPLLPYSDRVLDILAAECVKATFFLVGRHARAYPAAVRRIYGAGHTIGTHSQSHPLRTMSQARAEREIDDGIESITAALGDAKALAPFFRIPGLLRTPHIEAQAKARDLVVWSSDTLADDWRKISADQVLRLALSRLQKKGRGVLLLHDIQPRTVLMLPTLLSELKRRGFKIVHVVPEGERPVLPKPTLVASAGNEGWPRVMAAVPRATTGSSSEAMAAAAPANETTSSDVPLPPARVRPVRHVAAAKFRPVIAMRDLHAVR
jgi:peptidoglycan/xylan/chitin deacetylase (PgdA/CDA1 family)